MTFKLAIVAHKSPMYMYNVCYLKSHGVASQPFFKHVYSLLWSTALSVEAGLQLFSVYETCMVMYWVCHSVGAHW